jgi:hypothetical protein
MASDEAPAQKPHALMALIDRHADTSIPPHPPRPWGNPPFPPLIHAPVVGKAHTITTELLTLEVATAPSRHHLIASHPPGAGRQAIGSSPMPCKLSRAGRGPRRWPCAMAEGSWGHRGLCRAHSSRRRWKHLLPRPSDNSPGSSPDPQTRERGVEGRRGSPDPAGQQARCHSKPTMQSK